MLGRGIPANKLACWQVIRLVKSQQIYKSDCGGKVGWTARGQVGSLKLRCTNNWVELSVKADIS